MKLLMDASSILGAYMHIKDEEYGVDLVYRQKEYHIPDAGTCLERFQQTMSNFDHPASDFIVVHDPKGGAKTRQKILPCYKAKPRAAPPEFQEERVKFFATATEWLKSQGAIVATPKIQVEADDLIIEIANRLGDCEVWTRDKDFLAQPNLNVLLQGTGTLELNPEKYPVKREHIHLYRTIVTGDTSDNIPSCKGFGPKTWADMVIQYGYEVVEDLDDLIKQENLYKLVDDVDDFSMFQKILDQRDDLYAAYRAMQPLPVPAHKVKWEGGVEIGPCSLVTTDNYDFIYDHIKSLDYDYAVIDYEGDTCQASRDWRKKSEVKVDVLGQEITGMGLRIGTENFYFSVDHARTNNITLAQLESVIELLWGKQIFAHNASFEQTLTHIHFDAMLPNMECTMLMAHYVDENDFVGLKHLSKKHLGFIQASYEETLDGKSGMREISGDAVLKYGLDDVIVTDGLKNLFQVILRYEGTYSVFQQVENDALYHTALAFVNGIDFDQDAYNELKRTNDLNTEEAWAKLSDMLLDLDWEGGEIKPITNMNIGTLNRLHKAKHGCDIPEVSSVKMAIRMMDDRELAKLAEDKNFKEINDYYRKHWKPAAEFNVRSFKQTHKLLYEALKLPIRFTNVPTDKMRAKGLPGNPSTDESAIMNAIAWGDAGEHQPLLELLVEYKGYLTKESLFLEKYPKYVHWKTGRIHASLRQTSTTTRRFTCSAPNLQQLPKRAGKEYRNMLKARKGYSFWALDFTGQELRLAADDSRDPNFLACYIGDNLQDPHSLTGLRIAQQSGEGITNYHDFNFLLQGGSEKIYDYRVLGKKINFTAQYGAMAPKVAKELCIAEPDAQKYLTAREDAFPTLMDRVQEWHVICKDKTYATTMLGARRHLHSRENYGSRDRYRVQAANRLSYSMRIQGSAAEMTKLCMGRMYRDGHLDDGLVIPSMQIHDELVLQIRDDAAEERVPPLITIMCQSYGHMIVPMETEPETGKSFGSLKKVDMEEFIKEVKN